jgi:hypothetical protein
LKLAGLNHELTDGVGAGEDVGAAPGKDGSAVAASPSGRKYLT